MLLKVKMEKGLEREREWVQPHHTAEHWWWRGKEGERGEAGREGEGREGADSEGGRGERGVAVKEGERREG